MIYINKYVAVVGTIILSIESILNHFVDKAFFSPN